MKPETKQSNTVKTILNAIKPLAALYYQQTGKPLGVTGEIAEAAAAEALGLELVSARTVGYDAVRQTSDGLERIEIKGRALGEGAHAGQKIGRIRRNADCDTVMLVLMDNATLEPSQIWAAPYKAIEERLDVPGSNARKRGVLSLSEFKQLGAKVWPKAA